jgi:hypothetical protein
MAGNGGRRSRILNSGEWNAMKKALWWVGGLCAATAGFLVLGARRVPPVEALECEREAAWRDEPIQMDEPIQTDAPAPAYAAEPAHTVV